MPVLASEAKSAFLATMSIRGIGTGNHTMADERRARSRPRTVMIGLVVPLVSVFHSRSIATDPQMWSAFESYISGKVGPLISPTNLAGVLFIAAVQISAARQLYGHALKPESEGREKRITSMAVLDRELMKPPATKVDFLVASFERI
jgi:hypothetical protein